MLRHLKKSALPSGHYRLLALTSLMLPCLASAQIRTDGSVGPAAQNLTGPRYTIAENLGRLSGSNLFHSFQSFNLGAQESASFTTSSAGIANVISRVTGGTASQINGTISLTAASGAPNFYFINPAGVTFGAGAAIDVPGAFHVSTANSLRFADGSFHADLKAASTFSSSPPEAFGFLGTSRAAITVRDKAELSTRLAQPISLVAGDVEINNALVQTTGGGDIRIAATGSEAVAIGLSGALPALQGNLALYDGGLIRALSGATLPVVTTTTQAAAVEANPVGTPRSSSSRQLIATPATPSGTTTTIIKPAEPRNGGNIVASAGEIKIDGKANKIDLTGIVSTAAPGNSGSAGSVDVSASRSLTILDGGAIASNTYSSGNSGSVSVNAGSITVDGKGNADLYTAIGSTAFEGTGNAGAVIVNAQQSISLLNGGLIASPTFSAGNAGSVKVVAASLLIDGQGNVVNDTGISSSAFPGSAGNAGSIDVAVSGKLSILNSALIDTSTTSSGNAGSVKVVADTILIDGKGISSNFTGISSTATADSKGNAGNLNVTALTNLLIFNAGGIISPTASSGNAGSIKVGATNIVIDGQGNSAGITSGAAANSSGRAGSVEVAASGILALSDGGLIDSSTAGSGNAGIVKVTADNLIIDGKGNNNSFTGVSSAARLGSSGKAGSVEVDALSNLVILNGGNIASPTASRGDAGSVKVSASNIILSGGDKEAGITSRAEEGSTGKGGNVSVSASGNLVLENGGIIDSVTAGSGNAGSVKVSAADIAINGNRAQITGIFSSALSDASGNAGNVEVRSSGAISLANRAFIDSSTVSNGNAGIVTISAAENLSLSNNAFILSATGSSGAAGSINVSAANITLDASGILASASEGSSGQTGNININAGNSLTVTDGGKIAIENFAVVPNVATSSRILSSTTSYNSAAGFAPSTLAVSLKPTLLNVSTPNLMLSNSQISAASTGNVAASNIAVDSGNRISLNGSTISTSANEGNGGSVNVRGGNTITLNRSQVTTSVTGRRNGNGGNITVEGNGLALNNGFIQANTAASNASGGNVSINVKNLVPSLGTLLLGGNIALVFNPDIPGLNVIQAAAPTGLSGNITTSSPVLNISGSLVQLRYQIIDTGGLGRSPCQINRGSSFTQPGRGGLPASNATLLPPREWVIPVTSFSSEQHPVSFRHDPRHDSWLAGCIQG